MIRNKRIKVLSFLLTVSILSTLICIPVCAKQNEKSAVIAIQNAIQSIAFEKEHYGFSSVNLSDIWIGNSIPTYSVEDSTISKSDDLEYYGNLLRDIEPGDHILVAYDEYFSPYGDGFSGLYAKSITKLPN